MRLIADTGFYTRSEARYKAYAKCVENAVKSEVICRKEAILIQAYVSKRNAIGKITAGRKYSIANNILILRKYLPDFRYCTNEDVFLGIEDYREHTEHVESSQAAILAEVKSFLLWLCESGNNKK